MNLALSDEQEFLREAARGALSRVKTIEGAREALEGGTLPDLWPTVVEAGWPGLLIDEDHGGAGLSAFDAMLVAQECGRVLAGAPLLGLLPASALLQAAGDESLEAVAAGDVRPAWLPARPPGDLVEGWTVDARSGKHRPDAPRATVDGDSVSFTGEVAWVPDAPGADLLVVVGVDGAGAPLAGVGGGDTAQVQAQPRYDATARWATSGSTVRPGGASTSPRRSSRARGTWRRRCWPPSRSARWRPPWRWPCGTPRSASPSVAPSAPTRPSSTASPRSCAARRTPARCCTTRAGPSTTSPSSSRWRPARRARPPARRSTSRRARTSSRTAGSGRRGSTTHRCSSAARSCAGGCSAARATRPTAWPRSCSRRPDRPERPAPLPPRSALADGQEVQRAEEQRGRIALRLGRRHGGEGVDELVGRHRGVGDRLRDR